ncbi:MAG: PIN domain-containing protein [Ignavibacteriaceae bacterium]
MKIYIDNCLLNRPFDDQTQERIYFETQSLLILLKWIDEGKIQFLNSFALEFEVSAISDPDRGLKVREYLKAAEKFIEFDDKIEKRALEFQNYSFTAMDAMHIAVAEYAKVDYFVTCDDDILKTAKKYSEMINVKVISIANLVSEVINYAQNN